MKTLLNLTQGQDLIEYALVAGFVAMAAGAILPAAASSISAIFSQVAASLPADVTQLTTVSTN